MFFISFSFGTTITENHGKALHSYSLALLDEVMKKNEALVDGEDNERFTAIYVNTFLQSAKSIYTAKRHANTLAEALPILKDKVNICDLIVITGIKIFYPKLYEVIKNSGGLLAGPPPHATYDEYKRQIHDLNVRIDAIIDWHDEQSDNGSSIREMLILLFPRLNIAYRDLLQTDEDYLHCVEKGRICSDKHFELYFSIQYATL